MNSLVLAIRHNSIHNIAQDDFMTDTRIGRHGPSDISVFMDAVVEARETGQSLLVRDGDSLVGQIDVRDVPDPSQADRTRILAHDAIDVSVASGQPVWVGIGDVMIGTFKPLGLGEIVEQSLKGDETALTAIQKSIENPDVAVPAAEPFNNS